MVHITTSLAWPLTGLRTASPSRQFSLDGKPSRLELARGVGRFNAQLHGWIRVGLAARASFFLAASVGSDVTHTEARPHAVHRGKEQTGRKA